MSLDRFLGGKKKKKSKKRPVEGKKKSENKKQNSEKELGSDKPKVSIQQEKLVKVPDPINNQTSSPSTLPPNNLSLSLKPENSHLRALLLKEFNEFTKEEIIEILINQIHSSATYAPNKNMIFQLLKDEKTISEISILLGIPSFEVFILTKEILSSD